MTTPTSRRPAPAAPVLVLVRTVSTTAWQTVGTVGFMIMIGLVGSLWLPWLADTINHVGV